MRPFRLRMRNNKGIRAVRNQRSVPPFFFWLSEDSVLPYIHFNVVGRALFELPRDINSQACGSSISKAAIRWI